MRSCVSRWFIPDLQVNPQVKYNFHVFIFLQGKKRNLTESIERWQDSREIYLIFPGLHISRVNPLCQTAKAKKSARMNALRSRFVAAVVFSSSFRCPSFFLWLREFPAFSRSCPARSPRAFGLYGNVFASVARRIFSAIASEAAE